MAFINIKIDAALSLADINQIIAPGSTKPREVVQNLENILDGIKSGTISAEIVAQTSTTDPSVGNLTSSSSATLNLK